MSTETETATYAAQWNGVDRYCTYDLQDYPLGLYLFWGDTWLDIHGKHVGGAEFETANFELVGGPRNGERV